METYLMPKFAPVAPIQVLEGLWAHSPATFGNYHLLLAHHTVAHKKRFSDLFDRVSEVARVDGPVTVIMDNSIVELGDAVDFDMIAEAVNCIDKEGIDVLPVLPDVMGKGHETRQAVSEAYPAWEAGMPGIGFMAVCQGENLGDYIESIEMFGDRLMFPSIEMLGIPRVLHKTVGTRIRPAIEARKYMDTHRIHFLGFCDKITDDIDSVGVIRASGIDSAVPLRVREVFGEFTDAGPRSTTWFDEAQVDSLMIDNLANARQMFEY
jgi:hypothetical protein